MCRLGSGRLTYQVCIVQCPEPPVDRLTLGYVFGLITILAVVFEVFIVNYSFYVPANNDRRTRSTSATAAFLLITWTTAGYILLQPPYLLVLYLSTSCPVRPITLLPGTGSTMGDLVGRKLWHGKLSEQIKVWHELSVHAVGSTVGGIVGRKLWHGKLSEQITVWHKLSVHSAGSLSCAAAMGTGLVTTMTEHAAIIRIIERWTLRKSIYVCIIV
jgi:hypothetical protein